MHKSRFYHKLASLLRLGVACAVLMLGAGCRQAEHGSEEVQPRAVRVVKVEAAGGGEWSLTGTVRARYETPLAFRIGGQILRRLVQAGEEVHQGQLLFELDPRDVDQLERAAAAQVRAAEAEAQNAERERQRLAALLEQGIASQQAYELAETMARSAGERLAALRAQHQQALQQREYTRLTAPHSGTLVEVTGEPGQVVAPGQPVAVLAQKGAREIEVFVPENRVRNVPTRAEGVVPNGKSFSAELREVAGAADPVTRTWRARFRLLGEDSSALELGGTARLRFSDSRTGQQRVPLSAIHDEGSGPMVWRVRNGQVEPVPVRIAGTDGEDAYVEANLEVGAEVVAVGTHLLHPGENVRPLP